MGVCKCGLELGLFQSGLCSSCLEEEQKWQQALALVQRLKPLWTFRPPVWIHDSEGPDWVLGAQLHALGPTPEGDQSEVVLKNDRSGYTGTWTLVVSVNGRQLCHARINQFGWIARERLDPYLLSIPPVLDWIKLGVHKLKERAKEQDRSVQEEWSLKQKYGLAAGRGSGTPSVGSQFDAVVRDYDVVTDPVAVLRAFFMTPPPA